MIFTEHDTTEHVNGNDNIMRNKTLLRCTMHLGEEACHETLLQFSTQVVSSPLFVITNIGVLTAFFNNVHL